MFCDITQKSFVTTQVNKIRLSSGSSKIIKKGCFIVK